MPLDNKKVIQIILEESANIDDRCEGYKSELAQGIAEIISYERENMATATNIQQKINDKCNAIGKYLSDRRK